MNEEIFKEHIDCFLMAVKEHTLLIVIDSKSKGSKAVFSLVYYHEKNRHCAGRYSLFILDNIGQELKKKGVNLPEWWYKEIQNQNVI